MAARTVSNPHELSESHRSIRSDRCLHNSGLVTNVLNPEIKPTTKRARSNAKMPLKCASKAASAGKSDRCCYDLNAIARQQQASPRFTKPRMFDKISGTAVKYALKEAGKMAFTKSGSFSQDIDQKFLPQVPGNPSRQLGQSLHRARLVVRWVS